MIKDLIIMKGKLILSNLFIMFGLSISLSAQDIKLDIPPLEKVIPNDTIYYFFEKAAKADANGNKMTKYDDALFGVAFNICCLSIEQGGEDVLLRSPIARTPAIINKEKFRSIKLTTLPVLIDFIKTHFKFSLRRNTFVQNSFGGTYFVYIIEPKKGKFILYDVDLKSSASITVY